MNRREFLQSALFAAAAVRFPSLFAAGVTGSGIPSYEQELFDEMMAKFNELNPIDPATGKRKFISLGALSDVHACKRTAGDDDPETPNKGFWYYFGAVLTDSDPSIRLLGTLAEKAGFDAIIHAGDFSTANSLTPFQPGDYRAVIRGVKARLDLYAPNTPFFTVDGNHDRDYWNAKTNSGNRMDDAEWADVLKEINTDVAGKADIVLTRHRDLVRPTVGADEKGDYTGNSYTLDFRRLVKRGGVNLRLVVVSLYDKCAGSAITSRAADGFRFDGQAATDVTPANTVVGFLSHDMMKSLAPAARAYLDRNAGARFFGGIAGHLHYPFVVPYATNECKLASSIHGITNCYCTHGTQSRESYRFSVFVFDTEKGKLHEIRLAGGDKPNPKYPDRVLRPNRPTVSTTAFDVA